MKLLMTDSQRIGWVLDRVAECMGVHRDTLVAQTRQARPALARQIAYYVLRDQGLMYREIGAAIGGRDHSTVHHGCARIRRLLTTDREVNAAVEYASWLPEAEIGPATDAERMLESLVSASDHLGRLIDEQAQFLKHLRATADGVRRHVAASLAAEILARNAAQARRGAA